VVEFNERIKWFARIKTGELDGNIVAEGKYRNRCIHEDEVYFEVINETPEKTFCKIVAIIQPQSNRQIVGKIDFLEEKRLYYITPINKRFVAMNVRMNEIQKPWLK
jgi:exoribonuclease R